MMTRQRTRSLLQVRLLCWQIFLLNLYIVEGLQMIYHHPRHRHTKYGLANAIRHGLERYGASSDSAQPTISERETDENSRSSVRFSSRADQIQDKINQNLDLPWNERQKWALLDNLPKFTFDIVCGNLNRNGTTMKMHTLWRTMCQDSPELSGYPLPFVIDRFKEMQTNGTLDVATSTTILPLLDNYSFESQGGLTGHVYGMTGVADGTRLTTSPVTNVNTLQAGYVVTADGSTIYELGQPALVDKEAIKSYSLEGHDKVQRGASLANDMAGRLTRAKEDAVNAADNDLIKLGALTVAVLGGALAVDMLSHHLTINVFWV